MIQWESTVSWHIVIQLERSGELRWENCLYLQEFQDWQKCSDLGGQPRVEWPGQAWGRLRQNSTPKPVGGDPRVWDCTQGKVALPFLHVGVIVTIHWAREATLGTGQEVPLIVYKCRGVHLLPQVVASGNRCWGADLPHIWKEGLWGGPVSSQEQIFFLLEG